MEFTTENRIPSKKYKYHSIFTCIGRLPATVGGNNSTLLIKQVKLESYSIELE